MAGACLPGISGNGCFILLSLEDHEDDENYKCNLTGFVKHIASRYDNEICKIDTNTCNPSRHLPIPGTWKYRDEVSSSLRPHRRVEIELLDAEKIRHIGMDEGSSRSTSF